MKSYDGNQWVIDNCAPFSEVEKAHLAFFMAIQIIRTKTFRDTVNQTVEKTMQTLLYKQQMDNEDALPKEYFDVQANKDYIKLQHLSMLLDEESTLHIADTLLKHIWVMYINKTDNPFYTSDTPIISIPHKKNQFMTYSGLNSEGIEIVFPISPKLLIALYDPKWYSHIHQDRMPVLFVSGDEDFVCPNELLAQHFGQITAPQKKNVVISKATHTCFYDQPTAFLDTIIDFTK